MREKRWMFQMFKYIHLEELAWKSTMSVTKTTHAKRRDCTNQDDLPNSQCVMGFRKAHDDFWTNVDFGDVAFNLVVGNTIASPSQWTLQMLSLVLVLAFNHQSRDCILPCFLVVKLSHSFALFVFSNAKLI
jgi:hypothetical protein